MGSAKARQSRLEHGKLVTQRSLAALGADLEIERAYRDLRAAQRARKATRNWFLSARDGFNAGLEDAGELIDAVKEYGIIRAKYFEAVYKFNRAWITLNRATGSPVISAL